MHSSGIIKAFGWNGSEPFVPIVMKPTFFNLKNPKNVIIEEHFNNIDQYTGGRYIAYVYDLEEL